MKKFLLLTFTLCLSTFAFAQQYGWTDISANLPQYSNYNDVHFIGDEGWITGWNDGLLYTPDGGETFQIQTLPENSGISSSIFMKSNEEGYVVTYSGNILKTDNGGTTWTTLHEPGNGLNSVHFPPNSDTGYACGSNGTIWSFDDTSITDISPSGVSTNLQSICFPVDNSDGKVCGETTIARRKNNTWKNLQFYDSTIFYNSIFFTDNDTGWCVGTNGTIIRTIDGFSWIVKASNTTKNLNDVFFLNSMDGWTAGTEVLLHTDDGGETWTQELANQTFGKELRAIYFTSANSGYIVGNGTLLKYTEVTGISDRKETTQFEISPNPATEKFKVQSEKFKIGEVTIELYDLNGRKLLEKQIPAGIEKVELDVSDLNNGIYFCKIWLGDEIVTKKVIIQK